MRQYFQDPDSRSNFEGPVSTYRIRQLIPGWTNDELFALGTESGKAKILLLEITINRSTKILKVTDLGEIPDLFNQDDFTARMPARGEMANGAKCIFVASIGPDKSHRRRIYRVKLPTPRATDLGISLRIAYGASL